MRQALSRRYEAHSGYTLVELMVATALLALLLQMAIPAFLGQLAAWQRDAAARTLSGHLALARTEAIKQSHRVVVCNSLDGKTCADSSEKDWKVGWLVFQDRNSNGQFDEETDSLVTTAGEQQGIQSMLGNASSQRLVFLPNGLMSAGMGTIRVKPRTGATQPVTVSRVGRVRFSPQEHPDG